MSIEAIFTTYSQIPIIGAMTNRSTFTRVAIALLSTSIAVAGAIAPASASYLNKRSSLTSYLYSRNACFIIKHDRGNFVIQNTSTKDILWQTGTSGRSNSMTFQPDGNLVVYASQRNSSGQRTPLWASGTDRRPGTQVVLQNDGNLVMRDRNRNVIWSSGSYDASYADQRCN
jgi:hypothetical protein